MYPSDLASASPNQTCFIFPDIKKWKKKKKYQIIHTLTQANHNRFIEHTLHE